jgi:CP family cyanate transporter-like MFS transporter
MGLASSAMATTSRRRWWMLGSLWTLYASFGLVAGSLAPLLDRVRVDLGMSRAEIGAALGAWPFVYLFVAIAAGRVLDRIGLRWGLALGAFGIAASGFARAAAQGRTSLWLAVALFGLGGPFVSIGAPKLVSEWFDPSERGRAVGIYSTAGATGSVVALLVAGPLRVLLGSWRWVLVVFGAVGVLAGIGWIRVARRPSGEPVVGSDRRPAWNLLGDRTVRWVMVLAIGSFFLGHSIGGWMPEMLRTSGWSETGAAWVVALGSLCGIAGSVLLPPLATDRRRGPLLAGLLLLIGVALWPLLGESRVLHLAVAPLVGTARVTLVPISMLILMSSPQVDARRMGAAGGLFFTAGEIGGVAGPWLTGVTRDLGDDFSWSVTMLSVVALVLAGAALAATRQGVRSRDAHAVSSSRPVRPPRRDGGKHPRLARGRDRSRRGARRPRP